MVKLADEPVGWVSGRRIHKTLTDLDRRRLAEGVALPPNHCRLAKRIGRLLAGEVPSGAAGHRVL